MGIEDRDIHNDEPQKHSNSGRTVSATRTQTDESMEEAWMNVTLQFPSVLAARRHIAGDDAWLY